MQVLAVTHGPLVGPELFGDVVLEEGHELVEWDIRAQGAPPASGFDAVFVFGGDQNVGEELEHPWLHSEYDALRRWVDGGAPLFAVCLGAQTLAHALGGDVARAPVPLAGFYDTRLTDAGAADPVVGSLPKRFEAFNACGFAFTVPPGAIALADGPMPQAFRAGNRAWGVQFHPEARLDQALAWFRHDAALPRPLEELERELEEKLPAWNELGRRLARAFLRTARYPSLR